MKVAAAVQASLDAQHVRDLERLHPVAIDGRSHRCTVVTCERARFWRERYDHAQHQADVLAAQLRAVGHRPTHILDGSEA